MTLLLDRVIEEARLDLAAGVHTPSAAMIDAAKRGVRKAKGHNVDPAALAVGRRIASGQKLTDDHVEHIASYNAALDSPPAGDSDQEVEHLCWGGAPGETWSNARCAAMDISQLSEDAPRIVELDEDGKGVSLEIFVRNGMGEALQLENDIIWAPILRSGMIATRPGPNGEKVEKPLKFVAGRANDPHAEIGLQNLVDNFKAGAVQHVTIPTSHRNDVLENTGFIKDVKIVPSKKQPGEVVLMGAHDVRDPAAQEKIKLGTIANRSCGILFDYVDTTTGKRYDQVLDHVALTNRPWVRGMKPYGEEDEADLSEREVVPMLLSEDPNGVALANVSEDGWDGSPSRFSDQQWTRSAVLDRGGNGTAKERYGLPIREPDGTLSRNAVHSAAARFNQVKDASLVQKKAAARTLIAAYGKLNEDPPQHLRDVVASSTGLSDAERAELLLADVQWGSTLLSMNRITDQVVALLQNFCDPEEVYPVYRVMDVTQVPDPKALVRVNYGDPGGVDDAWVIPLELDGDKVSLSDYSQWTPVQKEWVTDEDAAQDKQEVGQLVGMGESSIAAVARQLDLAVLTTEERKKLPDSDFALPGRQYPIHDLAHARDALARVAQHGTPSQQRQVRAAVHRRYPQLKPSKTNLSIPTPTLTGGAMPPTITQEALERMNLSEADRAAFSQIIAERDAAQTQLSEQQKQARTERVAGRVHALQEASFPPGFCRIYEEIALGDDGLAAASLNLSDETGKQTGEKTYTVTEVADRLVAALPLDDSGKLAFSKLGTMIQSPLSGRPPLTVAEKNALDAKSNPNRPQSAEEFVQLAEQFMPEVKGLFNFEKQEA